MKTTKGVTTRPVLAITMGDAAGVGPEIIAMTLSMPAVYEMCRPLVVGDATVMQRVVEALHLPLKVHRVVEAGEALYMLGTLDVLSLDNICWEELTIGKVNGMAGRAAVE